jgi:hypothetical protein
MRHSGDFCDAASMEGSPFPICKRHALRLFVFMQQEMAERVRAGREGVGSNEGAPRQLLDFSNGEDIMSRMPYRPEAEYVYYVAVGEHVKIGYTADIRARMRAYTTGKLLAVEPGGAGVEARRLRQFSASLAAGREWFHRTPALIRLIDHLRDKHRIPDVVPARMLA